MLCDNDDQIITTTLDLPVADMCQNDAERGFVLLPGENGQNVWVFGSHYLGDHASGLGRVIAGIPANDALADAVYLQSGLEYSILQGNTPIVTSLSDNPADLKTVFASIPVFGTIEESFQRTFTLNGEPYYAVNQILEESPDLRYEVAISVEHIITSQEQLLMMLVAGFLVVIFLGSLAGHFLSPAHQPPTGTAYQYGGHLQQRRSQRSGGGAIECARSRFGHQSSGRCPG